MPVGVRERAQKVGAGSCWGWGSVLTSANGHGHQLTPGHWVGMGSLGRCWEKLPVLCLHSHQEPGWVLTVVSPVPPFLFPRTPVDGDASATTWLHPA